MTERSPWEKELSTAVSFLADQVEDLVTLLVSTPPAEIVAPAMAPTLLALKAAACTATALFLTANQLVIDNQKERHAPQ